jgi:hypothetical protein
MGPGRTPVVLRPVRTRPRADRRGRGRNHPPAPPPSDPGSKEPPTAGGRPRPSAGRPRWG